MAYSALVPVADGTEEIEAVCIIDTLRRAGVEVTAASVGGSLPLTASRGVKLTADALIDGCTGTDFDLIALPGGMPGAEHLRDSVPLTALLKTHAAAGRLYGAICAAPAVVLHHHGLIGTRRATAHPAFSGRLPVQDAVADRVVVDGNCVTSRGPGTALAFSLKLVELLCGTLVAAEIRTAMLVPEGDADARS